MKLYHYTTTACLIEHILPKMRLRLSYLSSLNDPREKERPSFGGVGIPYSKIYSGYYNQETHIRCQYMLGKNIKDRIQVACFSGANDEGWNNEMMWAHYAGNHSGVCIEIDETVLMENSKAVFNEVFIENVDYSETEKSSIYWNDEMDLEGNIANFIRCSYKELVYKKSHCWSTEDERRMMVLNQPEQVYISIANAITDIYLGIDFIDEYLPSIKSQLPATTQLHRVVYQNYTFEKWSREFLPITSC